MLTLVQAIQTLVIYDFCVNESNWNPSDLQAIITYYGVNVSFVSSQITEMPFKRRPLQNGSTTIFKK